MHRLHRTQRLAVPLEGAWDFFSDPRNLDAITPPGMRFRLVSDLPDRIYPGLMIEYRLRPLFNIPVTWVTEITHVDAPYRFVDEQRVGPYAIWHHEHRFTPIEGGVEIEDLVSYSLPFGPLGSLVEPFLVQPKLAEVFDYRRRVLASRFGNSHHRKA
jgi:ligand-binding SRPBCC domain-containing protein